MKDNYFIKIEEIPEYTGFKDLKIRGEFKVPNKEESVKSENSQILKHVILVVTRSGNYQSVTPFSETVIFNDDVKIISDSVSGVFNITLSEHIDFDGEGDFYIMCSLGVSLSNTLKISF